MTELNGRPAIEFKILISERQFEMSCNGEVFALSSSMETFCKGLAKMWELSGKDPGVFMFASKREN